MHLDVAVTQRHLDVERLSPEPSMRSSVPSADLEPCSCSKRFICCISNYETNFANCLLTPYIDRYLPSCRVIFPLT